MKDVNFKLNEKPISIMKLFDEYYPISNFAEGRILDNIRYDNLKEIPTKVISYIEENFDKHDADLLIDTLKKGHSYIELLEYPINNWESGYMLNFTNKENYIWYGFDEIEDKNTNSTTIKEIEHESKEM